MSLIPIEELLSLLNVTDRAPATVMRYDLLRQGVEAAVKRWCHWEIEAADAVEYLDGQGFRDLPLGRPWVQSVEEVRLDPEGFYGDGLGGFDDATVLQKGVDYVLVTGQGGRGLLRRLTGAVEWWPSDVVFAGGPVGLSYQRPLGWPTGYGNLMCTYRFGFDVVPDDVRMAVTQAVSILRYTLQRPVFLTSESLGDYSY